MEHNSPVNQTLCAACCIAGGGPAGMMLGFLLARAGVQVVVLEKHADFLRDFRGDTIHPSTLETLHELGLLDALLERPHQEVTHLTGLIGDSEVTIADFTHLPTRCKFLVLMPQWDFLDFLNEQGRRYPSFSLKMEAEVTGTITEGGRVAGVRARTPQGEIEVRADLVVAADGRHSVLREQAGLDIIDLGAPMDVLWMRLSRLPGDPHQTFGRVNAGRVMVMINRNDYWQCAFVIRKGNAEQLRRQGLQNFRDELVRLAPYLRDRVHELSDWNDIKLLTVSVDHLRTWHRSGLLCIGDAAHAMSPIGGVGINLAIQDAVAAANILAAPLRQGAVKAEHLAQVQARRGLPTRLTQRVQIFLQNRVIRRALGSPDQTTPLPWILKLWRRWPVLQRIPARLIGIGFRPEHVRCAEPR